MEQRKKEIRKSAAGKTMTDQFYVDGEVSVPETKSDVGRIVCSRAQLKIDDMKPVESYVRVTGKIRYQILYTAAEGGQRMAALQGKLSFEEMVYAGETPKDVFLKEGQAELTASVIHPRKLSLRAAAELTLIAEAEEEAELTLDVEEEPGLYRKWETRRILRLQTVLKDTLRIREECAVGGQPVGTLLFSEVDVRKLDTRLGTDELKLRGELQVFALYETAEGKTEWTEQSLPFEGKLDCYGAEDSMYYDLTVGVSEEMVEARVDENGERKLLGVEAALSVRASVYCEEELPLLRDVYSLREKVTPETEEIGTERLVMQKSFRHSLSEQLSAPELSGEVLQICHTGGTLSVERTEAVADGVMAEGTLRIRLLCVRADDEMPFASWQGTVPFTCVIPAEGMSGEFAYQADGRLEQLGVSLLGDGELQVRASVDFCLLIRKPETLVNIRELRTEPCDPEELLAGPGIVGYVVKAGDELWTLAKRYHTTEEGIRTVNGLEGDALKPGEKLLIFRENMGIL